MAKRKTSLGTWAVVVAIIVISVASAAYQANQKAEMRREIDAKYPTSINNNSDQSWRN